jgi:hypothetical protein
LLKIDIKKVLGIVIGIAIIVEGGLLISTSAPATIDNFGGIRESTVILAGAQLALLGILISVSWLLLDLSFVRSRPLVCKLLFFVALAINLVVMAEGLYLTTNAEGVSFEGGSTFGRVAAALLSAQLFFIGAFSTSLWIVRERKIINILAWTIGIASALGLAAIGASIIGVASPLTADFITGIGEGKMMVAGSLLMLLSTILVIGFLLNGTKFMKGKVKIFLSVVFIAITALAAIGSVYLSALASHFELGDFFAAGQMYMAAFFVVTFMLSALVLASWWMKDRKLDLKFVIEAVGVLAAIILAGVGVEVFGLAGKTEIEGLFTLPNGIVLLLGVQLILLPCIVLTLKMLEGMKHFNSQTMKSLFEIVMLFLTIIITFEGIGTMIVSSPLSISNGYGFTETTMFLFGTSVAASGIVMLLAWNLREAHSAPRQRRFEVLVIIFMVLMLLAALLI